MARPTGRNLRDELMDSARRAIQRGGTSFSYQRLAADLGVRAPTLHHHAGRKGELIDAVTLSYVDEFLDRVDSLPSGSGAERIDGYIDLFAEVAAAKRFCLCGSLAADWDHIEPATKVRVRDFFAAQHAWLAAALDDGMSDGSVRTDLDPELTASLLLDALEGALLIQRTEPSGPTPIDGARSVLTLLCPPCNGV